MDAHPGLLFKVRRDFADYYGQEPAQRRLLVDSLEAVSPDRIYDNALGRWRLSLEQVGATCWEEVLASRLLTGLGDKGVFEWGIRLHHTYGMPVIPGSTVKGSVAAFARDLGIRAGEPSADGLYEALFGDTDQGGAVVFHDAWWMAGPGCPKPFIRDVMTPHHLDYGTSNQSAPADWDSPTPVSFVAVRGRFLFAVESASPELAAIARKLVHRTLSERGIGAKTRSGYGVTLPGAK